MEVIDKIKKKNKFLYKKQNKIKIREYPALTIYLFKKQTLSKQI